MSSFCGYMDHPDWTPEQRVAIALVETLPLKRSEEEQARAAQIHARTFSTVTRSRQDDPSPADTAARGTYFEEIA